MAWLIAPASTFPVGIPTRAQEPRLPGWSLWWIRPRRFDSGFVECEGAAVRRQPLQGRAELRHLPPEPCRASEAFNTLMSCDVTDR
jgi:hypothetical protein